MILETKDKLLLAAVLVCLFLGIFIGKGCNDKPPTHRDDKASVDSTVKAAAVREQAVKRFADSVSEVNKGLARYAAGLATEKARWQRRASDANDSAEFYATRYQLAMNAKDTGTALASCDSLVSEFHEYQLATVETISRADSMLKVQDDMMANLRVVMGAREEQVQTLTNANKMLADKYADLFKDYKKERRKDNWFNKVGKPALGVIAGGLIVYAIKQ